MKLIQSAMRRWPDYVRLEEAVKSGAVPGVATGLSGVHKCCLIASLCQETRRRALVIAADEAEAQRFGEDLAALGMRPAQYPLRDFNFRDTAGTSHEYERLRLEALSKLENGDCDCVIACIDAALQYTLGPKELEKRLFTLRAGDQLEMDALLNALVQCGYVREDQIEGPGQFSRRGGIVDFFSPSASGPVRVEFWGDEVDSLSSFDLESQRRTDSIPQVTLAPCVEVIPEKPAFLAQRIEKTQRSTVGKNAPKAKEILHSEAEKLKNGLRIGSTDKFLSLVYGETATLFDYFSPENSLLFFSEGNKLKERMRNTLWQWGEDLKSYLAEGLLCKGLDKYSEDWEYALSQAEKVPTLFLDLFARGSYEIPTRTLVNMTAKQLSPWGGRRGAAGRRPAGLAGSGTGLRGAYRDRESGQGSGGGLTAGGAARRLDGPSLRGEPRNSGRHPGGPVRRAGAARRQFRPHHPRAHDGGQAQTGKARQEQQGDFQPFRAGARRLCGACHPWHRPV